jgi:hypothetical protein
MNEREFLEKFAILAEMKKVVLESPIILPKWEIKDEIMQAKEGLHDWMIHLKIENNKLSRVKLCKKVNLAMQEGAIEKHELEDTSTSNVSVSDMLNLHFENQNQKKALDFQEEEDIASSVVQLYTQEQIQTIYQNHLNYEKEAHEFCKNIGYLKTGYQSTDVLVSKTILTSENFYNYLRELFDKIIYHSKRIMKCKLDKKNEKYYRGVNIKVNPLYAHNTIFPNTVLWSRGVEKYQVVFDAETRYEQSVKQFSILTNKLYLLLVYVKDTTKYLNIIIQNYIHTVQLNTYVENMVTNHYKYVKSSANMLPILPTNFTEYFCSFFYQVDLDGNSVWSIRKLYRYMVFEFAQNKEWNELRRFIKKTSENDVIFDYITFLFGDTLAFSPENA